MRGRVGQAKRRFKKEIVIPIQILPARGQHVLFPGHGRRRNACSGPFNRLDAEGVGEVRVTENVRLTDLNGYEARSQTLRAVR
jgi:hypothetical protein